MLELNADTRVNTLLETYPGLMDEIIRYDGRASMLKTPMGKMIIGNATVADAARMTGIDLESILQKLGSMIGSLSGEQSQDGE